MKRGACTEVRDGGPCLGSWSLYIPLLPSCHKISCKNISRFGGNKVDNRYNLYAYSSLSIYFRVLQHVAILILGLPDLTQ